jgi:hypothetical protein
MQEKNRRNGRNNNRILGCVGTFTFEELREDLKAAGFSGAKVVRHDEGMNAVIVARKR